MALDRVNVDTSDTRIDYSEVAYAIAEYKRKYVLSLHKETVA
jgi:hypothetical protein